MTDNTKTAVRDTQPVDIEMPSKPKPEPRKAKASPASKGPSYTIDELAANARRLFNASPDITRAALKKNGVTEATLADAEIAINQFKRKKV